ncbi:MAG: hypothetical protein IJS14_06740 [Lentisphaeria bacterium]|nr:hypothetical protein [Lentisphaeria bacterium]
MRKTMTVLALLASGPFYAQELVKNGQFDQDVADHAESAPAGWQDKSGSWIQADNDGVTDANSARFTAKKNAKGELRQTVACKPGTAYILKAALKNAGAVPKILVRDGSGKVLAELKADPAVRDEWQEHTAKFRTGAKTAKLTVAISAEGTEGRAVVDEVSIVPQKGGAAKGKGNSKLFAPPAGTVNLALNRPYKLTPAPKYSLTMDKGDAVQLTDGKFTRGHFWTQKSSVGWSKQSMAQIIVDLGKVQPIRGFLYSCAGNPEMRVGYPGSIIIYTSRDRKKWYYLGDLWSKSLKEIGAPEKSGYALYRAASMNMPTCGRWVCFQVIPTGAGIYADEVMVFKGGDELLESAPAGIEVASPAAGLASLDLAKHFRSDADAILTAGKDVLSAEQQKQLAAEFGKLLENPVGFGRPDDKSFIPLLPLHPVQERIFAKNNAVLNALGYTKPMFWQNCRWDNLSPIAVPPKESMPEAVTVDMMPGEVRAETVNILNPTDKVIDCKVTVEGLPAGANLDCREVLFMDTKQREYVASALKPGQGSSVTVRIHPGTSRQVWFSFVKPKLEAGVYKATVKADCGEAGTLVIPLQLAVSKVAFPARPRLHVGGWEYLDFNGKYYHTPGNVKSTLSMLKDLYVDAPWARRGVMPAGAKFDRDGHLLNPDSLDYARWNEWTAKFPDARRYCIYLGIGKKWNDEAPGTERFNRMLKEYLAAFAKHLRATGKIRPEQIVFGLVDEPRSHAYDLRFLALAKPVRAADRGFSIFLNPIYPDPTKALQEIFDNCDIVCPDIVNVLASGDPFRDFYLKKRDSGKTLWLYACSGPARLLDPVYYHRVLEWQCFALGAKAAFYWAFGCGGGKGDSWHAYAQPGLEYSPYYVSPTDTMAAKQSEGIREGIQDYEYLSMLRDRVTELRKAGKSSPDLDAAEKLLVEGPRSVIEHYSTVPPDIRRYYWVIGTAIRWKTDRDRTLMDKIRIKALRLLEKLQ